jgi:hydrogenase maturation protease
MKRMNAGSLIDGDAPLPADWARTLMIAVGNPSRGDDAAGPLLAERLSFWLKDQGQNPDGADPHHLTVLCDQQLMVEHAYDLRGRDRVLFIDAAARQGEPVQWQRVEASACGPAISSHQCTPAQLLHLCAHTLQIPPPQASLLSLRGEGFELGAPVSGAMHAAMAQAWDEILAWVATPEVNGQPVRPAAAPHHA